MVFFSYGCETTAPTAQEPEPVPEVLVTAPVESVKIDPDLLYNLLTQADAAIKKDHLTYPEQGSAYSLYLEILAIEPAQTDAIDGLEHIVEEYIALAMRALDRNQYAGARSMLARARIIMPDHPSIKPTDVQIRLLSQAQRTRLKLNQDELKNDTNKVSADLQTLLNTPPAEGCRFIISAKDDAQGRWIYQALAKGAIEANEARVRAQIKIRLPAGVERLCFGS
jgi:hypothetical protein